MMDFSVDQMVMEEQYKDRLRDIETYRLLKAASQSRADRSLKAIAALRRAIQGLTRPSPSLSPTKQAQV